MGLFLFIDGGPVLVCGWVNFPILWPHPPVQMKLKCPPRVTNAGFFCFDSCHTCMSHQCTSLPTWGWIETKQRRASKAARAWGMFTRKRYRPSAWLSYSKPTLTYKLCISILQFKFESMGLSFP